ncbi:hypothetical protein, partial [Vibrio sp. 10N.222.55.E7]|uniref:hypothetical protein n=1 Tax=Vibrio sp. 10N.222.55.E7 TaxID=3229651 RepID=UPI00354E87B3
MTTKDFDSGKQWINTTQSSSFAHQITGNKKPSRSWVLFSAHLSPRANLWKPNVNAYEQHIVNVAFQSINLVG